MLLLALCSCERTGTDEPDVPVQDVNSVGHDQIVLGDKLDDPYKLSNMQAAYDALYATKSGRRELSATNVYVRFLPADDSQYELLQRLGFTLVDHPLDYRILQDGDYYHDPDLPEEDITWQYAVVPAGTALPSQVRHEVLDDCYIPENDAATKGDGVSWAAVERMAYEMTGNADMLAAQTRAGDEPACPKGRITVLDGKSGEEEGLAGVMVCCNQFVKFATAYTDDKGNYELGTAFSGDTRYRLVFKNKKGFAIGFNLILLPASTSTLGTNSPQGVSLQINSESERKLFCRSVVNNAAYYYYAQCVSDGANMPQPPSSTRIWIFQALSANSTVMLQHGAVVDNDLVTQYLGKYASILRTFLPDITIGAKLYEEYDQLYAATCHELAHASHFTKVGAAYWDKFITYILRSYVTSFGEIYGNGMGENAGYCEVGEMWGYYLENSMYKERYGLDSPAWGFQFWFSPHILLYLEERGLDRYKIFEAFSSETTSAFALQKRLKELYPDHATTISQAFTRYGK